MELSNIVLHVVPQSDTAQMPGPSTFVPVALIPSVEVPQAYADAADWSSDYTSSLTYWGGHESEDYAYHNAATCPDCGGGMIRQGRCCVCPSCGFESCLV